MLTEKETNHLLEFARFVKANPQINGLQEDGALKAKFEKMGRRALKALGSLLQLPSLRVVYSGHGEETAGYLTGKGMFTPDNGIFIQFNLDGVPGTFLFRKLLSKKDKVGLANQFASWNLLENPEEMRKRVFEEVELDPNAPFEDQTKFHAEFEKGDEVYHPYTKSFGKILRIEFGYLSEDIGSVGYLIKNEKGEDHWVHEASLRRVNSNGKADESLERIYDKNPKLIPHLIKPGTWLEDFGDLKVGDLVKIPNDDTDYEGLIEKIDTKTQIASVGVRLGSDQDYPLDELELILPANRLAEIVGITHQDLDQLKSEGFLTWPLDSLKMRMHRLFVSGIGNLSEFIGRAMLKKLFEETGAFYDLNNRLILTYDTPSSKDLEKMNLMGKLMLAGGDSEDKGIASALRDCRYRVIDRYGLNRWHLLPQFRRGDFLKLPNGMFAVVNITYEDWSNKRPIFAYQVTFADGSQQDWLDGNDLKPVNNNQVEAELKKIRKRILHPPQTDKDEIHALEVHHQRWNRHLIMVALAWNKVKPAGQHINEDLTEYFTYYHADINDIQVIFRVAEKFGAVPQVKTIYKTDQDAVWPAFVNPFKPFPKHLLSSPAEKNSTPKKNQSSSPQTKKPMEVTSPNDLLKNSGFTLKDVPKIKQLQEFFDRTMKLQDLDPDKPEVRDIYDLRVQTLLQNISSTAQILLANVKANPSPKKKDPKVSEEALKRIEDSLKELEHCDQEIKSLKKERKELLGDSKEKEELSPVQLISKALLSAMRHMPEKFKTNLTVLEQSEQFINSCDYSLKKLWGMTKIQKVSPEIISHFEEKEDSIRLKHRIYGTGDKQFEATLEVPGSKVRLPNIIILGNSKTDAQTQYEEGIDILLREINTPKDSPNYRYALPKEAQQAKIAKLTEVKPK